MRVVNIIVLIGFFAGIPSVNILATNIRNFNNVYNDIAYGPYYSAITVTEWGLIVKSQ